MKNGGNDSGIFASTDAGATWTLSGIPGKDVWELAICPDADSIYFAATFDSLYRSTDFSATWHALNINSGVFYSFFYSIKIAPSDGNSKITTPRDNSFARWSISTSLPENIGSYGVAGMNAVGALPAAFIFTSSLRVNRAKFARRFC